MDEAAFDGFYAASFRRVVGQIYAICGSVAEAQDCTQEAFIRAWDRRRSLDNSDSWEAWVRTVAYRLAVSRWRRRKRHRELITTLNPPQSSDGPDETRVAVRRALQELPLDQRRAVVLYYLGDLSVAEIAEETHAPLGTVKARLSRGRKALAALLGEDTVDPSPAPASHPRPRPFAYTSTTQENSHV